MLVHIVGTVLSAILVLQVYRYIRMRQYDKYDVIYKHYPGPCIQLEGADGGSEDLTTLPDGLTFISSGVYPWTKGRILLFDFKDPAHKVTELQIDENIPDFRPHGLSVWTDSKLGTITLIVVSHGGKESVEIFEYTRGTTVLKHIRTVLTGGTSLNDIVAVSKDTFYGTQTFAYDFDSLMSFTEFVGLLELGKLWYFNGKDMELIDSGLNGPNGINISPDKRYVYVAEFNNKDILTYERKDNGRLRLVQKMYVDTSPDNIEIDPNTGDLWIGCHPRVYAIFDYHFKYGGKSLSPSQVLKIKVENGLITSDITEVFLDDGQFCSASATASYYDNRMIIGTVGSELVLCDVL